MTMFDVNVADWGLEASGVLDAHAAPALLRAVSATRDDIWLDASGVQELDGAGLTALAVARGQCRSEGREFVVTGLAPQACRGLRTGAGVCSLFGPRPASPGPGSAPGPVLDSPPDRAPQPVERRLSHRSFRHRPRRM